MKVIEDIYVGGKWIPSTSENSLLVRSPSTEEAIAQVPDANAEDMDAAVRAARAAFDHGPWPRMKPSDRADVMRALLAELTERADELAHVIGTENGTPQMLLRLAQVDNGLDVLRYYTDVAAAFEPEASIDGVYSPAIIRRSPSAR
jgi:aldehyde dehydrogenase (NAD+)